LYLANYFAENGQWRQSAEAASDFLKSNPRCNQLEIAYARSLNGAKCWQETVEFLKGVDILPSEFGDNACDLWQEAWRNLGDEKMAQSYPEHLGKGAPYPDKPVASAMFGESEIRLYAENLAIEVVRRGKTAVAKTSLDVMVDAQNVKAERLLGKTSSLNPSYTLTVADFASFVVRLVACADAVAYRIEPKSKLKNDSAKPLWHTFKAGRGWATGAAPCDL
jgi:hypothetical protein